MIAMTGLALLGTAGALGYREIFGGSVVSDVPTDHHSEQRTEQNCARFRYRPKPKTAVTLAKAV